MSFFIPPTAMDNALVCGKIKAFREAVDEMDRETQDVMDMLVETLAEFMKSQDHPRLLATAREQAAQVVAQMVWTGKFDSLIIERAERG